MQLPGVHLDHANANDGNDLKPPELDQAVPQEGTTQNESTEMDFLSREGRDSILSAKHFSLTRELDDLRRHVNDSMRRENDERFTQVEALGLRLEEERTERGLKLQEQDDRITELESSHKQMDLEQKAQSEQTDPECSLNAREIEGLSAKIDSLSHKGEVRDNELRELTQRLEETSAQCNVKFEESHTRHAEVVKICRKNNEWCGQLEELAQRLEAQIAETNTKLDQHSGLEPEHTLHTREIGGQDDCIAELEPSQKQLDLEQRSQSEQIESEHASRTHEIEGLAAQIDTLSRDGEVRNNDLRELAQRFEETSAECSVRLEESNTRHAEIVKICRKNNERCSQLEEVTQRLETQIAERNPKLDQDSELDKTVAVPVNFETFHDQFESRLASERKTCQELIEAGVKSHASGLQELHAMFDARIKDLSSRLDAECADRKEKQQEQHQVEISRRTREATWAEEISSQKKLIEAETSSREQLTQALSALIAQSSDRENTKRQMQLQDLESRVESELKTCAGIIQELSDKCGFNSARIEELASSQTQSRNQLESLWDLQQKSRQDLMESGGVEGGERTKLFATLRALVVESAQRQSEEIERRLEMKSGEQNAKVDDQNAKIDEQHRAHAQLAASHQQLTNAHQQLTLLFQSLDDACKELASKYEQVDETNKDLKGKHAQILKMFRKSNEKESELEELTIRVAEIQEDSRKKFSELSHKIDTSESLEIVNGVS